MTDATMPPDLGAAGRDLWLAVTGGYDLAAHEQLVLLQAARTADACERLQAEAATADVLVDSPQGLKAHPALVELRAQRLTLARLLVALRIPDDGAAGKRLQRRGTRGVYGLVAS